ncbi:MAG: hypothetical protein [Microviridae sp.]|nr:MAG: hypothetical protein [Microviridae sp.]
MGAIEAGAQLLNTGLGIALEKHEDKRQINQQQKLQNMQITGQKEMGEFNQGIALDTWDKTNYEAQRKHMEAAGLNVGLMYGGAGASGTTQSNAGSVSGGSAAQQSGEVGMALQMGMQRQMQEAQIELMKAQGQKTQAETAKLQGVDTAQTEATTANIKQTTANAAIQAEILEYDKQLKQIETNLNSQTVDEKITQIKTANQKLEGEAEQAKNAGKLSTEGYQETMKQLKQTTGEQALRMGAIKTGIQATDQQIKNVAQQMMLQIETNRREWQKIGLSQGDQQLKVRELTIRQLEQEFKTSTPEKIKQWVDIFTEIVGAGAGAAKAAAAF